MIKNYIENALDVIFRNRMRSFLTCLGVAIGASSIVVMLALTGGVRNVMEGKIDGVKKGGIGMVVARDGEIKAEKVEEIKKVSGLKIAVKVKVGFEQIKGDDIVVGANVVGTEENFVKILGLKMVNGQFLEDEKKQDLAVLGVDLSRKLFGTSNAVGRIAMMMDRQFLVVGVLDEIVVQTMGSELNLNNAIIVNSERLDRRVGKMFLGLDEKVDRVGVKGSLMRIGDGLEIKIGDEVLAEGNNTVSSVVMMLGVMSAVALLIGGIGVMNIMLVAIGERTKEIGVRKAVGAKASDIIMQFLIESVVLSVAGGVMGIVVGSGVVFGMMLFLRVDFLLSWEVIGVTLMAVILIGILFGVYPAIVAGRKRAIESLK